MIYGKKCDDWLQHYPLLNNLINLEETSWFNPNICCFNEALSDINLTQLDVDDAEQRLMRFAPYLASVFPETQHGIIESPCKSIPHMQTALSEFYHDSLLGNLLLKMDNELPISGSIKARGGIYEVLKHAEDLVLKENIIQKEDNYILFNSNKFKQFFGQYEIAVGSTGNLGLSIGIMSTKLGFKTTVHMSADAREWKKVLLRKHGATVIEYNSDYSKAVEEGRKLSQHNPNCYFVDDENSKTLFLGYAVAAKRLQKQLIDLSITVDKDHPLFVYLPCGVGGGPGGVAFGLKLIFKDNVHCIFAEPTHSPSMFLGVYTGLHDKICVQDLGIDNKTAADGLAVGRPSGFVGKSMQRMIDGFYSVSDDNLYRLLAMMFNSEKIKLEPSALAGLPGIINVLSHQNYRQKNNLNDNKMKNATHIAWATGGSMVPDEIIKQYIEKGEKLLS